ncbi:MAG TPA: ATP-binding protein, partial [Planctomycetaceae bacterium]
MTLDELRAYAAAGESETVEFKRTTGELQAGLQTVCAFLNGGGGVVLFGVRDDGRIEGQQVSDSTLREVAGGIGRIEPPVSLRCESVEVGSGRSVIAVRAGRADGGPFTFDGRPYERVGTVTRRMPQREYERRLLERSYSTRRWESLPAEGYRLRWL